MSADGVRKLVAVLEDVHREGGRDVGPPTRIAAVGAVISNPLSGAYVEDLEPLIDAYCEPLGELLTARALELLGAPAEGFGKGALVGLDGDVEHGSAIIHNLRFGNHVRDAVGGTTLLPSAEKRAAAGATLDLAIKHVTDQTVRSHHQTFEVRIPDAPRADEIVIWVVLASSGRPHARLRAFGSELVEA
ncbi:MAG TPA: amino acid synthesis family protein [Gaiellaceae bacterium]|nr:amino acid synthesis family protein [Gaiellaceae bacterium]